MNEQGLRDLNDEIKKKPPTGFDKVKAVVVVLSGKGGVGKSTVSANLAAGLAMEGKRTGLLDVDVHGPSIPRLLKLTGSRPDMAGERLVPVDWHWNLGVMSIGFLLPGKDDAVIWRGPAKAGVIQQLAEQVGWGERDVLVVDCPPGTGDEPLSVLQIFNEKAMAVIVTSPQDVALDDVRRSITFCRQLSTPIVGIVENLSGFACPSCGAVHEIFSSGGGERLAKEAGVPFLGRIPIDPEVARSGDDGDVFLAVAGKSPSAVAFKQVIAEVVKALDNPPAAQPLNG
ncbi:Mrp/NBP35 family ATP-binding protein [Solidesulfovibrio sp.]|jgi:ATP-binding protein involved in chromosome partitioning|uniref:Mrp/NBP35 family ATP-binding protein n=1 Tax=Solidesulfovibrio sp. TaxID=2910990 RepID=UPI000EF075A6|nr:Mrp/NBP35 family ATP-binding protein [Solidesulfovibrio sp.]MEA5091035.1 Mrp/NBP35 family ATP-binding protein [Solidesulfovibrio sp.]HCR13649.1 ATP-binding protein [Desulfovibrio sp.]HML60177.1 Mrp/NBP35 family ATP-binding protein [Solidesulfovibrio sp.]